jgi:hypothetical protein
MSSRDYERTPGNMCLCGHPWWDHGDGLDQDGHINCESIGCPCLAADFLGEEDKNVLPTSCSTKA